MESRVADTNPATESRPTRTRLRFGPLVALLGSLFALVGFLLPWISFNSVVSSGSPTVNGYEAPGFLRSVSYFVGVAAGQDVNANSWLVNVVWGVPALALVAALLAMPAGLYACFSRGVGPVHILIAIATLLAPGYAYWWLLQLVTAGSGELARFIGLGLWVTLVGMLLVLAGGILEVAGR